MTLFFFTFIALFTNAQNCPDLTGKYKCIRFFDPVILEFKQVPGQGATTYSIRETVKVSSGRETIDYEYSFTADGTARSASDEVFDLVERTATCNNNSLSTTTKNYLDQTFSIEEISYSLQGDNLIMSGQYRLDNHSEDISVKCSKIK